MVMEVEKVDDVEVDKVAVMVVKIPYEDFTDVIQTIGDTFGYDGRAGAGGWRTWRYLKVTNEKADKKVVE